MKKSNFPFPLIERLVAYDTCVLLQHSPGHCASFHPVVHSRMYSESGWGQVVHTSRAYPSYRLTKIDKICIIGPFKPYLTENIFLHSSNCNILGLAATVVFLANKARFTQISVFFMACSLQNEVGVPPLFLHF